MDVPQRMKFYQVPGISVAVIDHHHLEWAKGYGVLEVNKPQKVNEETKFQAASISKFVTTIGALRLVEEGVLQLDVDVNLMLRSWNVPLNGGWQPRITLKQLLSHTAGINQPSFVGYARGQELPDLLQVLRGEGPANHGGIRVDTIPGTQFNYSGGGFCIVQQLMIDVTGTCFPQLMQELVLEPAGMVHSTFEQPLLKPKLSNYAIGHRVASKPIPGGWHRYPEMAAAGLWSTPTDLANLILSIFPYRSNQRSGLLSEETWRQIFSKQSEAGNGLGIFMRGEETARRYFHLGINEGFRSKILFYPRAKQGIVVMTNADPGDAVYEELIHAIGAQNHWPGYAASLEPKSIAIHEDDHRYIGSYELSSGTLLTILRQDSSLWVRVPGQSPIRLLPQNSLQFLVQNVNAIVEFVEDENGAIHHLILKQRYKGISKQMVFHHFHTGLVAKRKN